MVIGAGVLPSRSVRVARNPAGAAMAVERMQETATSR